MKTHFFITSILFSFFFLHIQSTYSQSFREGFFMSRSGRITNGFVRVQKDTHYLLTCEFKYTLDSEVEVIRADEIKGYGIGDARLFFSKEIMMDGKPSAVFLETLILGSRSLYVAEDRYFVEYNSQISELETRQESADLLAEVFADCDDLSSSLSSGRKNISLEQQALIQLFEVYYQCKKENFTRYRKPQWHKLGAGIWGGVEWTKLAFKDVSNRYAYLNDAVFQRAFSPAIGFYVEYSSPRINDRLFATFEFSFQKYFIQGYSESENNGIISRRDIFFSFNEAIFNLGAKYTLVPKWNKLFINTGVTFQSHRNQEAYLFIEEERTAENEIWASESAIADAKIEQLGFWAGLGANIIQFPHFSIPIQIRYQRSGSLIGSFKDGTSGSPFSRNHIPSLFIITGFNFN